MGVLEYLQLCCSKVWWSDGVRQTAGASLVFIEVRATHDHTHMTYPADRVRDLNAAYPPPVFRSHNMWRYDLFNSDQKQVEWTSFQAE